ncbi:MAG TPA: SulP family inorganic anion transporter [Chitinophagaceae bacterium]|nr:SulP family inorganic anion transporter [Chitinophagaceae bacterium]
MIKKSNLLSNLKYDISSGLVVFLVALPLCLGIAMASGAPLFSGIISGVIGGIIIGAISNSHISVSGPAAGLTAIIVSAIFALGSFEALLTSVFIAGVIQCILGFLKAGSISNYFPNNVIEGMLTGIGIIIVIKQFPKAIGSDVEIGNGLSIFADLADTFKDINIGVVLISTISILIIIIWDNVKFFKKIKILPSALVAVIIGTIINEWLIAINSPMAIVASKYLPMFAIH